MTPPGPPPQSENTSRDSVIVCGRCHALTGTMVEGTWVRPFYCSYCGTPLVDAHPFKIENPGR